jgi:hypothetical protein
LAISSVLAPATQVSACKSSAQWDIRLLDDVAKATLSCETHLKSTCSTKVRPTRQ